jgi:hypothetical protein
MLTVSGKSLGRRKPLFADFSAPPPADFEDGGSTTLRKLIECVIRHEVAEFQNRQAGCEFIRVLTERDIEAGLEAGRVESGGSEVGVQAIDEDRAVAVGLQAFEDGLYLVAVDGAEQRDLDAQIFLKPDSRLTFIRLSLLAGG